jgi:60 kDa SS-A/Ro ribonucleoprotein
VTSFNFLNRATNQLFGTTPQSQPVFGAGQVPNDAGGFVWEVDDWTLMSRFLVLGTEKGTYYRRDDGKKEELTREGAESVIRCLDADRDRAISLIHDISVAGRAIHNDYAIFALALAATHQDESTRRIALDNLSAVCRTGTHLLHFVSFMDKMRGWSRMRKHAISNWFVKQSDRDLAFQLMKYQGRDDWRMADVLRLAKPRSKQSGVKINATQDALFHWATKGWDSVGNEPHPDPVLRRIWGVEKLRRATSVGEVEDLIGEFRLPREVVPTQWLNYPQVWRAMLTDGMPMDAMIRNLATMTRNGVFGANYATEPRRALSSFDASNMLELVARRLVDTQYILRSRIHPIKVFDAMKTYASGKGLRGDSTWNVISVLVDALDAAFYNAFGTLEPSGRNILLALDCSGSMKSTQVTGIRNTSAYEGAGLQAMITMRGEKHVNAVAFDQDVYPLDLSPRRRLDDIVRYLRTIGGGGTDCAAPIIQAMGKGALDYDAFIIMTDSQTWQGQMHPVQALREYRRRSGNPRVKMVVVAMAFNSFTIADPRDDAGMLNCLGLDSNTPQVISNFLAS